MQPSLRNWLETANNHVEFWALQYRSSYSKSKGSLLRSNANDFKVNVLKAILLRSTEFPCTRVTVTDVLRVIRFLTSDLTNVSHDFTLLEYRRLSAAALCYTPTLYSVQRALGPVYATI